MTTYILDEEKNPVPADAIGWDDARQKSRLDGSWRVGRDVVRGVVISTVFSGIPISDDRPLLLFETLLKDLATAESFASGERLGLNRRYASWADATAGHEEIVATVRRKLEVGS